MINKFIPCKNCFDGYIFLKDKDENEIVKLCDCRKKYQNELKIKLKIQSSGLNEKDYYYNFNDYLGNDKNLNLIKLNKFIDNFELKYKNCHLYFYGVQGTQKTTLSKYLCISLIKKDFNCQYILFDQLIKILSSNDFLEVKVDINKYLDCDLLILDEFDIQKVTLYKSGYQLPFIISFLKDRLEVKKKSTIFISNNKVEELKKDFGETIVNLVKRECKDVLVFEDNYEEIYKSMKFDFNINKLWD